MDRLTISDKPIEGGKRHDIIDSRAVREEAMKFYWALKKYEDTGLTPEEIMDGKMLTGWIPVEERLPETNRTVLIFAESTTIQGGTIMLAGACHNGYWFVQNGQNTLGFPCSKYNVVAWMPLPEPYCPAPCDGVTEN